jgi:hypothetical protein
MINFKGDEMLKDQNRDGRINFESLKVS